MCAADTETTPLVVKKLAVVGGGVSGVCGARVFKAQGFNVTLYEAGSALSGVWAKGYPNFAIQTPGSVYEFPDKRLPSPKDYKDGPSIQQYTEDYAQEHGLDECIKLNTRVQSITAADNNKWTITSYNSITGKTASEVYDFVAIASGVYSPSDKSIPSDIEGMENFKGVVHHSVETDGIPNRQGKKVVVVGFGKSAQDCAMNAYEESGVAPTLLFRSAHWCVPRKVLGLIPMEWLLYSRFGQGTLRPWKDIGPIELVVHTILRPLIWLYWRIVQLLLILQYRLWGSGRHLRPTIAIEDDMYCGNGVISHPDFFPWAHSGKIDAVKGSIESVLPTGELKLHDGSTLEADELVFATGFKRTFDFFPKEVVEKKEDDGIFTYRQMLVPGVANICFLNSNVTTFSNITTPGIQAAWLAEYLKGNIKLPEDMHDLVEEEKEWRRSKLVYAGESRAFLIQLHQIRYWDSLLSDMGASVKRKKGLPIISCLKTFFVPTYSSDYESIITGEWKKTDNHRPGYTPSFFAEWVSSEFVVPPPSLCRV